MRAQVSGSFVHWHFFKEQLENLETISQVPFLVLESESQAPDCSFVQSAGVQGCGVEKIGAQADM
jgi:hypothetical protein